jgi:hypothetical protein
MPRVLLLLTALLVECGYPRSTLELWQERLQKRAFSTRPRPADTEGQVQLQLTNQTRLEQLVCVDQVWWEYELDDGGIGVGGQWFAHSPHGGPCSIEANWHRVPPGMSYSLVGPLERLQPTWPARVIVKIMLGGSPDPYVATVSETGWAGWAREIR